MVSLKNTSRRIGENAKRKFKYLKIWILKSLNVWRLKYFTKFASYRLQISSVTILLHGLPCIRSSEKFLSFYKELTDAQHSPFYIILSNYVWWMLFYQNKDHNVRQISFHVCIKMNRCKRRVCKRKALFGQSSTNRIVSLVKRFQFRYPIDCFRMIERSNSDKEVSI